MENGKWKMEKVLFYLLVLFLPTQLGKHFWPSFSFVSGIRVDYLSPTLYITDLLILLLFVLWCVGRLQVNKKTKKQKVLDLDNLNVGIFWKLALRIWSYKVGCFFFLVLLIVNIFFSKHVFNGFYGLIKLLEFSFVAFYISVTVRKKEQLQTITSLLAIGVLVESSVAVFQYMTQGSLGGLLYFLGERLFTSATPGIANASLNGELVLRPYGTFPHPNVLAGYLVLGLISLFSFSKQESLWRKAFLFLVFVYGFSALFLTMSRVAIGFGLLLFVILFLWRVKKVFNKKTLLSVIIIVGSYLVLFSHSPLFVRFAQTSFHEEAVVQREALMTAAAVMIREKPLLGVGLGNFLPTLSTIQKPLSLGLYLQPVHNIFLLVAAETGVFGFMVFIWFLFTTLVRAFFHPFRLAFVSMLLSVVVLGFFDHYFLTIQQGQLVFAFVVGLCWTKIRQ
jgi:O-antigen ligase